MVIIHLKELTILLLISFFVLSCGNKQIKQAETLISQKKYDEAEKILNIEIQKNERNPKAYYNLGTLFLLKEDTTKAKWAFDKAIEYKSSYRKKVILKYIDISKQTINEGNIVYPNLLLNHSLTFAQELKLTKSEDYAQAIFLSGLCSYLSDDYDQALKLFKQYKQIKTTAKDINSLIADCYLFTFKYDSANQYYQKYFKDNALENTWKEIFNQSTNDSSKNALIVMHDSVKAHSIDDEQLTYLKKYDFFPINNQENTKLYFTDTTKNFSITKAGWICESYLKEIYTGRTFTFYEAGEPSATYHETEKVRYPFVNPASPIAYDFILHKLPAESLLVGHYFNRYELINFLNPLLIPKAKIEKGSLKIQDLNRIKIGSLEFVKIKFNQLKTPSYWIAESDVKTVAGDVDIYRNRLQLLKNLNFLSEHQKENILSGLITQGMTNGLIKYQLGALERMEIKIDEKDNFWETYQIDSISLQFKNNKLVQWKQVVAL